jgi:hypothetical protein
LSDGVELNIHAFHTLSSNEERSVSASYCYRQPVGGFSQSIVVFFTKQNFPNA